jgi:glycerol 3-phosphatase-1
VLDVRRAEGNVPKVYGSDGKEIPGAKHLLGCLVAGGAPWGIVTSGTRPLVTGWLDVLGIPVPANIVTAEDVVNGKPDPACYLLGKEKIGLGDSSGEILVFEDAPAGIKAGKAAGCKVIGVLSSHTKEEIIEAGADWVVADLTHVRVIECSEKGVKIEFDHI